MPTKKISFSIDADLHAALKIYAATQRKTLQEIVVAAIKKEIKR